MTKLIELRTMGVIDEDDKIHIRTKKGMVSILKEDMLFPATSPEKVKMLDRLYTFNNPRMNQIGKMITLMLTVLWTALGFNVVADMLFVETSYLHPLTVFIPVLAWAWYYVKKLW